MKKNLILAGCLCSFISFPVLAEVSLNIYNNNLAFVKDSRQIELKQGQQSVAFEGVSAQLKPESAFVLGEDISIVEQNYDYKLINAINLLDAFVGKTVKTATTNPANGQDIFKDAQVVASSYGSAVLKFDYGVDPNFQGRIIYDEVPQGLMVKPSLQVVLNSLKAESKKLDLLYLTGGLSWKADYIADISKEKSLTLNAWVTIDNNSGTDYNDAKIQVIAGDVNQTASVMPRQPRMMMAKTANAFGADMAVESSSLNTAQPVGDYYFYDLPNKTSIKDKQSKQMSLFNKKDVKYEKIYKFISPLYIGVGLNQTDFNKLNPKIVFKIKNDKDSNLDILLPSGVVRFYENNGMNNVIFLGESNISQTATGESVELTIGQTSDFYATGKIKDVKQIAKDVVDAQMEVSFYNTKTTEEEIVFEQSIGGKWEMVDENVKAEKKSSSTASWKLKIPGNGKFVLNFKVRINN